MDISKAIAALKAEPGFTENVGMVLVHNGVVRGTSRTESGTVKAVEVACDQGKIDAICREGQSRPGIFRVLAKGLSGRLQAGDDVLFIIVAGDYRENVKATLAEVLDRIKSEAVTKKEIFAG